MIKILQVLTDTNFGGAGMWLLNYLGSFDKTDYSITVALPPHSVLKEKAEKLGVTVEEVEGTADVSFSARSISEYVKLIRRMKPDIIHTHASLSARIAAKLCGVKTVNTRHCLEEKKRFPINIAYRFINNVLSDAVIGVSEAVVKNLSDDGISPKKLFLVYNGIFPLKEISESEKAHLKAELGFSEDNIVAGIVARLEPVKGHGVFLDAAKYASEKNDKLRFIIAGTGSLEQELRAKAKELGLSEKVVFLGYIEDVNKIYSIIDISVLSSVREALSLSVIEAMSLRKPAVVTDSGGTAEVVENGVSGYVVENGNSKELGSKIVMLSEDAALRNKMGSEGIRIVKEKFTVEAMARKLEKVYSDILR